MFQMQLYENNDYNLLQMIKITNQLRIKYFKLAVDNYQSPI